MSSDTILTDEDGKRYSYDNLRTQGWLEGHESGLDHVVTYLNELAVDEFRRRNLDKATQLQNLADKLLKELRPAMRQRASEHAKEFPIVLEGED